MDHSNRGPSDSTARRRLQAPLYRNGVRLDLTELGPFQAAEDRRSDGFTPATRDVIVVRDAPAAVSDEPSALEIGVHPSRKFASAADVVAVLTPQEAEHDAPWLQNWERLLNATEDVVIG